MKLTHKLGSALAGLAMLVGGCATVPKKEYDRLRCEHAQTQEAICNSYFEIGLEKAANHLLQEDYKQTAFEREVCENRQQWYLCLKAIGRPDDCERIGLLKVEAVVRKS